MSSSTSRLEQTFARAVLGGTQDLTFLRQYVADTALLLGVAFQGPYFRDLIPKGQEQDFDAFLKAWFERLIEIGKSPASGLRGSHHVPLDDCPPEFRDAFSAFMVKTLKPGRYVTLLFQMALTHAFSLFDALLHDILSAVFICRPATLKSGSPLTCEQVLTHSSMAQLVNALADQRAKALVEGGLESLAKDLAGKPYLIDLKQFKHFAVVREAQLRRDVVVHHSGLADARYCAYVDGVKIGANLSGDRAYLMQLFESMADFVDYFAKLLAQKFHFAYDSDSNVLLRTHFLTAPVKSSTP